MRVIIVWLCCLFFLFDVSSSLANDPPVDAEKLHNVEGQYRLIVFHATWCGPCHQLDKLMREDDVKKMLGTMIVHRLDVDKETELVKFYKVQTVPLVVLVRMLNSKEATIVRRHTGTMTKSQIEKFITIRD